MRNWGTTPEYLLENWTDEQFERFWNGMNENRLEENRLIAPGQKEFSSAGSKRVSDVELFQQMGIGSA